MLEAMAEQHVTVGGQTYPDTDFRMGMYPSRSACRSSPATRAPAKSSRSVRASPTSRSATASATSPALGCYAAERLVPADRAVKLPANISYEQAAAMMLKGMTVEYLVRRTFKVQKGQNVLCMPPLAASA